MTYHKNQVTFEEKKKSFEDELLFCINWKHKCECDILSNCENKNKIIDSLNKTNYRIKLISTIVSLYDTFDKDSYSYHYNKYIEFSKVKAIDLEYNKFRDLQK